MGNETEKLRWHMQLAFSPPALFTVLAGVYALAICVATGQGPPPSPSTFALTRFSRQLAGLHSDVGMAIPSIWWLGEILIAATHK